MDISNETQERRNRAVAKEVAASAANTTAILRHAVGGGTTPTPGSVGGFFDASGAFNDFKRIEEPIDSDKPLAP